METFGGGTLGGPEMKKGQPLKTSPNENQFKKNITLISPRLIRLIIALLECDKTCRELIDAIPANNVAEYVRRLRHCYGLTVPCERISFTNCDGFKSSYGRYSLTTEDRKKARLLLRQGVRS